MAPFSERDADSPTPKPGETSVSPVVIGTCTIDVPFIAGAKTTVYGYFSDLSWESKRLPVGGTIFYVGPDNGATYHFSYL